MQINLVKPQIKDIVFDRRNKVEGRVTHIDYKTKKVKVEVIISTNERLQERTTKLVETYLFDLIVLERYPRKEFDKNRQYTLVKEFQKVFGHPVADKPKPLSPDRGVVRAVWKVEEIIEFLHALSNDQKEFALMFGVLKKGMHEAFLKSAEKDFITDETDKIVAQADALTDMSYFVNGSFVELGVLPQPLFEIVHEANMSKLFTDEDGNKYPKYHPDGKTMKSPDFFAPEKKLKKEILRQAKRSS